MSEDTAWFIIPEDELEEQAQRPFEELAGQERLIVILCRAVLCYRNEVEVLRWRIEA